MSPAGPPTRPDILMIVMDCVRASDFVGSPAGVKGMSFCEGLRRESWVFERAISPATWTLPAHASLFTGEYPWVHGVHAKGNRVLSPGLETLSEQMAERGYGTLSLSANPFIGGGTGLTRGFADSAWGNRWERYVRHLPHSPRRERESSSRPTGFGGGPVFREIIPWGLRRPIALNLVNRLTFGLTGRPDECLLCVSGWIEGELRSWLGRQPADRPVFVFVNLLEAHEPYLLGPASIRDGDSRPSGFVRQDFARWLDGRWDPSGREQADLTTLYRQSIRSLDHRLRQIVECFEETKRWDSTALILTSDHGQGMGERNHLSHGMSVDDSVTRVPLWVRPSGGSDGRVGPREWVSLTGLPHAVRTLSRGQDVAPELLFVESREGPHTGGEPVLSVSEGIIWSSPEPGNGVGRREELDRLLVAGYIGEHKLVYDATRRVTEAFQYDAQGCELRGADSTSPGLDELGERLRDAARRMVVSSIPRSAATSSRLEGWGY